MNELVLYHFDGCPYCRKVRNYLNTRGIQVKEKDILVDPSAREELIEMGGKSQVPCLSINGQALYESSDIIAWFEENFHG